jgi:hypothetical protein
MAVMNLPEDQLWDLLRQTAREKGRMKKEEGGPDQGLDRQRESPEI